MQVSDRVTGIIPFLLNSTSFTSMAQWNQKENGRNDCPLGSIHEEGPAVSSSMLVALSL